MGKFKACIYIYVNQDAHAQKLRIKQNNFTHKLKAQDIAHINGNIENNETNSHRKKVIEHKAKFTHRNRRHRRENKRQIRDK